MTIDDRKRSPGGEGDAAEIYAGLAAPDKNIPSKFFYDRRGSELFERITGLPEYYPTRLEKALLQEAALALRPQMQGACFVEYGSGDPSKISILLSALPARWRKEAIYCPLDVSGSAIEKSSALLLDRFPGLRVQGVVADFMERVEAAPNGARKILCFLGGTIGNLSWWDAVRFLSALRDTMQDGDRLLVGMDMVKEKGVLERAYNDADRVTEAFNKNILDAVNHRAGTDFRRDDFEHLAFFNERRSRVEMHLRARRNLRVRGRRFPAPVAVRQGESIHTENSYKFTSTAITVLAADARLEVHRVFCDPRDWFRLVVLTRGRR